MLKIAPSILAADFKRLGEEVKRVEEAGADLLHIDVMDGHFVPNLSMGPMVVKSLREITDLPFSVHLMVEEPERFIQPFIDAGTDILSVHIESSRSVYTTIQSIKNLGKQAGIALNPLTPLCSIEYLLEEVDMILLMSVDPGFGGQSFISNVLPKIRKARQMIDERELEIDLAVDGGVNERTALSVVNAGANVLVMGSAVFHKRDVCHALDSIRKLVS
ncbi:MAG: ribulose-phosphate 3-epimerase [Candidatus Bathyarchaeota archaeon]|nr:ribulose-phosphate 3-epimerase [Candidatus Bathyarchaeota archaeon]